ncbi:U11/U12 small nuclear ribonucleoprotein 59 kDa protein [Fagus crenata]
MNPVPFQAVPPQWFPMLPPNPPMSSAFWESKNVQDRLRELQDTLNLAKAMDKELEILMMIKDGKGCVQDEDEDKDHGSNGSSIQSFKQILKDKKISLESQESLSVEVVNALMSKLRAQLEPFRVTMAETTPWEEKSAVVRLSNKIQKYKQNKLWRKRKRKQIAEKLTKVEKMKEVAKLKAKEERKKLESELKKISSYYFELAHANPFPTFCFFWAQACDRHFLPDEDDKFLERVRAAVEEEERQAIAAADTDAAKDAIATAEESRKALQSHGPDSKDLSSDESGNKESEDQIIETENNKGSTSVTVKESEQGLEGQGISGAYDSGKSTVRVLSLLSWQQHRYRHTY